MKENFKYGSQIPRQQSPEAYTWKIADIFADEAAWETACKDLKKQLTAMKTASYRLQDPDVLLSLLRKQDQLAQITEKIYAYARLQQDADNGDAHFQFLVGKAETLLAAFNEVFSFLEPGILTLPHQVQEQLLQNPQFSDYHFNLENLFRKAPHVLSPDAEAMLSQSQLATEAGAAAFRALVSADLQFPSALNKEKQAFTVSEGTYLVHMTSPDRVLRKNAFHALMNTYHQYQNTLATTLTGACRSAHFYATVHRYPGVIAASLDEDNIPLPFYDSLITTVHKHLPALHAYIALKQKALQVDSLHPYDLYFPLSQAADTYHFKFAEACDFIEKALAPLGKTYGQTLRQAFTHRWIDRYENQGKRSGAYSWGIYGLHPYVLMSYQPNYRSMSTIAHELGHSLHSYFTNQSQPYAKSDYTIFCAEIASTTNEILLAEYALKQATSSQKLFLLNQILENIRTTVYRQIQFAEFEKYIHTKICQGESLQAQDLNTYWLKSNTTYYGPALTLDKDLAAEWSRIPHFYTPIYVYKYATGYAAATAFAHAILTRQPEAVEHYLDFLHGGASDYSLNLLQKAGVDFNTPRPLEITLQYFEQKLQELSMLLPK